MKHRSHIKEGTLFMLSPVLNPSNSDIEQHTPAKEVKEIFKKFNINPLSTTPGSPLANASPRKDRGLLRPLLSPTCSKEGKDSHLKIVGDKKKMNINALAQFRQFQTRLSS